MPAGRPVETDYIQRAKELLEWAQLDDSINLNGFCCTRTPPIPPSHITRWRNASEEFREAYETAKTFLADRREKNLSSNKLHVKAYDLNATVYDQFMKDEKRIQAELEAEIKAKALVQESKALSYKDEYIDKGGMDQK